MSLILRPGKKEGGGWLVGTAELRASPQHPASLRWVPIFEWLDEKMKAHVEWVTDLAKAFKKVPGGWKMGDDTVMAGVESRDATSVGVVPCVVPEKVPGASRMGVEPGAAG